MSKTWVVVDANNLCHRNFYAMGGLRHGSIGTAVVYGFMRDIIDLKDRFATRHFVFCFDCQRKLKRTKMYSEYKANRGVKVGEADDEAIQAYIDLQTQIKALATKYLPGLGYRNVFWEPGYEADDLIASVAINSVAEKDDAVIVSSDQDLWQLLRHNILIYNPFRKKMITAQSFMEDWGIHPDRWKDVKAMAGCVSDNVIGIPGVGEKSAARWQSGELKSRTKMFEKILKGHAVYKRNLPLVILPLKGTPKYSLRRDRVTKEKWNILADRLGIKSIRGAIM